MIGFCSSPRFVEHDTGPNHPERPDRIRAIYRALGQSKLLSSPDPFPDFVLDLGPMMPFQRPLKELPFSAADEKWLALIHPADYIRFLHHVCEIGGGVIDQGDTPVGPDSFDIALLALGGVLRACDGVMKGEVGRAFAAVRPPGHHAEPQRPMGFCLFANLAIAARYVQQIYGITRIAIVDFDVHHGNGTQEIFYEDGSVFFFSTHQWPWYPGTGRAHETGAGAGKNTTLNVPLPAMSGRTEVGGAFEEKLSLAMETFKPELVLISAGFDSRVGDPLGHFLLTDEDFADLTALLRGIASRHAGGRVISLLEGGYSLPGLASAATAHVGALLA